MKVYGEREERNVRDPEGELLSVMRLDSRGSDPRARFTNSSMSAPCQYAETKK